MLLPFSVNMREKVDISVTSELKDLRQRAGLSMSEIAGLLGYKGSSSYQRYESADDFKKDVLPSPLVIKLIDILVGKGEPRISREEVARLGGPFFLQQATRPKARPEEAFDIESSSGRMPVYGHAVGGDDGAFQMNGELIDMIAAPPSLHRVTGAYAIYVIGDSMEPRYFEGETLFINPKLPPIKGKFVVVQVRPDDEDTAPLAYVKQFVSWTRTTLTLEQYNPKKSIEFPTSRVISVHRVVLGGES